MARLLASTLTFAVASCTLATNDARVTPAQANEVASAAADQVRRCYRGPRIPAEGRRIVTRLRVRFAPDGSLLGPPRVLYQQGVTSTNQPYAERMAEAASLAVMRCSPLHLPDALHRGGWDEIDLTFSPRALV